MPFFSAPGSSFFVGSGRRIGRHSSKESVGSHGRFSLLPKVISGFRQQGCMHGDIIRAFSSDSTYSSCEFLIRIFRLIPSGGTASAIFKISSDLAYLIKS